MSDESFLSGSLWDKILKFALPLAATGILQQVFNAADIAVVGRFTGERGSLCMAAVGANTPIVGLIINLFVGVALGSNVVIANAIGSRRDDIVKKAVASSLIFSVIAGIVTSIIGELSALPMLRAQDVPDDVLPLALSYLRIYLLGLPVILLYNFEAAIFRGTGDTRTPLVTLTISGVINVGLNLLFVLGLGMTVDGVALATVLSNGVSALILLFMLLKNDSRAGISLKELRVDRAVLTRILRIGIPAGLQGAIFAFANIIIQSAINKLGTVVMAASSAAFNIETFAYYVFNSFSQSCTTFTGQNYGAKKLDRCRKSFILCLIEGYICLWITVFIILFFGRDIVHIFNGQTEVIDTALIRLRYIFFAYNFSILYEVCAGFMRGFGISVTPAILTMLGIVGTRLGWIWFVFPKNESFNTIMMIYPISLATAAVLNLTAMLIIKPWREKKS